MCCKMLRVAIAGGSQYFLSQNLSQNGKSTVKTVLLPTEEGGFEPPRRDYRPTGVRSQTLQPLGYSSKIEITNCNFCNKTANLDVCYLSIPNIFKNANEKSCGE